MYIYIYGSETCHLYCDLEFWKICGVGFVVKLLNLHAAIQTHTHIQTNFSKLI